jgi:RNA polymerase sigma factor (sigma-70 family)
VSAARVASGRWYDRDVSERAIAVLLQAARDGDQTAWDELVDRFGAFLWRVARAHRLPADAAADVVQTTWLRLLENLGAIRDPERLGGWLAVTARNEALRHLRRGGRVLPTDDLDALAPSPARGEAGVEAGLLRDERDRALASALARISERCRRLLRLLTLDPPVPYAEIGAALGMPVGSIGPTRARCLDRVRAELAVDGFA